MRLLRALPLLALCGVSQASGQAAFVDATTKAGITFRHVHGGGGANPQKYFIETMGAGCAFLDYDGDGRLDAYAVNGYDLTGADSTRVTDALLRNVGGRFEDRTAAAGIEVGRIGYGMGICAADVNGDGHVDLYVTNFGENMLYRNRGDGTFAEVGRQVGVADERWGTGCAFADIDGDGDLDLYAANYVAFDLQDPGESLAPYLAPADADFRGVALENVKTYPHPDNYEAVPDVLYRNDGSGDFVDVTVAAGMGVTAGKGMGVAWADLDDDGDSDLYVANDQTPNFLFRNDGGGHFTDVALESGVAYNSEGRTQAGMGLDLVDYDNDGRLDIWVTNFQGEPNALFHNEGDGFYDDASFSSGAGGPGLHLVGWGTGFLDVDRDGFRDIYVANGHVLDNVELFDRLSRYAQPGLLLRNGGPAVGWRFSEVTAGVGEAVGVRRVGRGLALGDFDDDGDLDLLQLSSNGPLTLLRNDHAPAGHWLTVKLRAWTPGNRQAIGARVTVHTATMTLVDEVQTGGSYLSQSDLRLHFGLGPARRVARVVVRWPDGQVEEFTDIAADRLLVVEQGRGPLREGTEHR